MELRKADLERFEKGRLDGAKFWARFGGTPDLRGRSVLDVGSGHGSLCVEIALAGARRVVGVDINRGYVDFATENLRRNFPDLVGKVEFRATELARSGLERFDCIVSKDTFEHVMDLEGLLVEMGRRLAPGGRIYAGLGPIYTSAYGDHDRRRVAFAPWGVRGKVLAKIPWAHLFLEPKIVEMTNRRRGIRAQSMRDLNLNTRRPSDYRRAFEASRLETVDFRVNQSDRLSSRILSLARKIPLLEDYCTHNIYCVLENRRS